MSILDAAFLLSGVVCAALLAVLVGGHLYWKLIARLYAMEDAYLAELERDSK